MGTTEEDLNKRRWNRYKVDLRVRLIYLKDGARQSAFARGNDVSEGGIAVFSPVEMNAGDSIDVEFSPPRSRAPLLIKGIVRNRQGYRYGVEFVTLSPSQRQDILRLCETAVVVPSA